MGASRFKTREELVSVETKDAPAGTYEPPAGYTAQPCGRRARVGVPTAYFPCEICRRSSSFSKAMPTWAVASSRMSMSSIGFSLSPLSV